MALPRGWTRLVVTTMVLVASGRQPMAAQELVIADRGPRFLLASESRGAPPVEVDVSRSATLRRVVSLTVDRPTVGRLLEAIERQTGLRFFYGLDVISPERPVSLRAERITVAAALASILIDTGVDVLFAPNGQAALVRRQQDAVVVTGGITGRVTDAQSGATLQGADVALEGTQWRTVTEANGRFRLTDVPIGPYTMSVRRIGYARRTQAVRVVEGAETTADVALDPAGVNLDAIVVTGTAGETQRRALGNSITQINAVEAREIAPVSDPIQLINGRAPGVVVQPGTGVVGSGARIRIRGASSLTLFSAEPLLYVDGVRVDNRSTAGPVSHALTGSLGAVSRLSDFSPESIESIEIIKGPAAAALYGTEATGGVIQIVTKRGRAGSRPQVAATLSHGANWFQDAEGRWSTAYGRDQQTGEILGVNLVRTERERGTPIFRTGQLGRYGLNVSGGTDQVRYFAGADLDREEGVEPTNSLRRFSGRLNLDANLHERLDVGLNLGLVTADLELPLEYNAGLWPSLMVTNPATLNTPLRGFNGAPPEVWHRAAESRGGMNRITAGVRGQHRLSGWLSHRVTLGLDYVNEDNYTLIRNTASDPTLSAFNLGGGGGVTGTKLARRAQNVTSTVDYGITASASLGTALTSSTSAGFQYFRSYSAFTSAEGRGFPDFSVTSISAAATTLSSDDFLENVTVGGYVQQQLGWRNRLFLTAALRADDNSAFGQNFDVVTYPKVSASWVLSEEPFWPLVFVDAFKLRAAWGKSGQQPAAFSAVRTYTSVGGEAGVGFRPGLSGNPDLGPERGQEVEVGFEAGLFGGRAGADFTYYNKTTRDALLSLPTIPSLGFMGTRLVNAGVIQNRGVEAMLRAQVFDGRSVGWEVMGTISHNNNEILELSGGIDEIRLADHRLMHKVGYPAFGQFRRKIVSAERGPNGTAINVRCDGGPENGNQPMACGTAPPQFMGGALPKVEGSISSTITLFGSLRLYGLVDFKGGYAMLDNVELIQCVIGTCRERFYPDEYDPIRLATVQSATGFDWTVEKVSFAKLRELSAVYALPTRWADAIGARRADVRISGRNLHTWTAWTGLDPESFSATNLLTVVRPTTPQLTQIAVTVNLQF